MSGETNGKADLFSIVDDQDKYKSFHDRLHEDIHIQSIDYTFHQIDKQNNLFN